MAGAVIMENFDKIAADADALATEMGGQGEQAQQATPEPEVKADTRQGVALLLVPCRKVLEMAVPHLRGAPEEAWTGLVDPVVELLDFYNVDMAGAFSSPWAKLGLAAAPLAMHGYQRAIEAAESKRQAQQPRAVSPVPTAEPAEPVPGAVVLQREE